MPVVFVSYAGPDTAWAEWVAWQLQGAGHTVALSQWHLPSGNFVAWIDEALNEASTFVALCSTSYVEARWTRTEWHAAVAMAEPTNDALGIVVIRLDETQPPPLLQPYPRCDLAWQTADDARALLLNTVGPRGRPSGPPVFPGGALPRPEPRLPRQLPQVWGPVPARNVGFTGRHRLLADLRGLLDGDGGRGRQALCGPGGAGKSQLAVEYVWRFAHDYDAVWWVDAQSPELIGKQLADFSAEWERNDPRQAVPTVETLWQRCKHNARWLLIFDNVVGEEAVLPWLPPVPGRVLLTSRSPSWREAAGALRLDGFERAESVELLARVEGLNEQDCEQLAGELDDLPLAVVQAAGVLETGTAASEYLLQLRTCAAELLEEGRSPSYPVTLAASVRISAAQLSAEDVAAGQLLALCAGMAPAPIPVSWLQATAADALPVQLAEAIRSPGRFRMIRSRLVHLGLAKASSGQLQLHRLTQRILHDTSREDVDAVVAVVCAVRPVSRSDWVELRLGIRLCASHAVGHSGLVSM